MKGHLLGRFPVAWPPDADRQRLVDTVVEHGMQQWSARKGVPSLAVAPRQTWLADNVLEVRVDAVTIWTVLTEQEIAFFWDAPLALRLLLTDKKRDALIQGVRRNLALHGAASPRPG
jgi:hypothetical protein